MEDKLKHIFVARRAVKDIKIDTSFNRIDTELDKIPNCRFIGLLYDHFLKSELSSQFYKKKWDMYGTEINRMDAAWRKNHRDPVTFEKIKQRVLSGRLKMNADQVSHYILGLLQKIDYNLLKPEKILVTRAFLKPPGGLSAFLYPDLIIDNKIIDIKTYDSIVLKRSDLVQLIAYATMINNRLILYGPEDKKLRYTSTALYYKNIAWYEKKMEITEIGIFFSKHNYLWKMPINSLWLLSGRNFCLNNKDNPYFKKALFEWIKYACITHPPEKAKKTSAQPAKQPSLFTHPV